MNRKPYPSSEDLKHHQLRYVVRTHDPESMFKVRTQTKAGQVGFTPHLFKVERASSFTEEMPLYKVSIACAVEDCGCTFRISNEQNVEISFEYTKEEILTREQVMAIYNFKDETLMLDGKEEQFHITSEYLKDYFPN